MKVNRKIILKEAGKFWERFGRFTFFKTKKEYVNFVLNNYKQYKNKGNKFLDERQKIVLKDLERREGLIEDYLKAKKKSEKIEEFIIQSNESRKNNT